MIDPNENQPSLNEWANESLPKKKNRLWNIKNAVNKAIAEVWIAGSLLWWTVAPEVASTALIPETAATITAMAPTTWAAVKTIALWTAAALASACDRPDITPPTIDAKTSIDIQWWEQVRVSGNQLYIWSNMVASWSDDVSSNCMVSVTTNWNNVLWSSINDTLTINLKVTDEAGNTNSASINVNVLNNAPVITAKSSVNIFWWEKIDISNNKLLLGDEEIASRSDDKTQNCTVSVKFNGKEVKSWDAINPTGNNDKISITVTDDKGKYDSKEISVNVLNNAPVITAKSSVNIFWWEKIDISNNKLLLGDEEIASRSDDKTQNCTVSVKFNGKEVKSWDAINPTGNNDKISITVTDDKGKYDSKEINVTNDTIKWLETLKNLNMQVDQEVDLLKWISFADWIELVKVEVEIDGQRYQVDNPHKYTPEYPWECNIIFTIKWKSWETKEVRSDTLTIKALEYKPIEINNIKPVDVFPQIWQIEAWDPDIYEYVKDLWVAETYIMRDMMWKYGSGDYAPEEIQELQSRVITGLIDEKPDNYQDYQRIWEAYVPDVDDHSNCTFANLISLSWIHTNIMNLSGVGEGRAKNLSKYAKAHPNNIFIFSCSCTEVAYSQSDYNHDVFKKDIIDLCDLPNVIIFMAGGDTKTVNWVNLKIIYNGYYDEINWDWRYLRSSMANSDQNNYPNSNMRVVIWTDSKWNANMTTSSWSLFPVWFNNNVIISGRPILPIYRKWRRWGEDFPKNWSYNTSYVAPADASETQLMFGLRPDVNDANKLLQMIESCTTDPDYISLNWQKQALQKYSPANFAKKYCLIMDIPSSIKMWEIIRLTKWRYKWLVPDIPWAVVEINWQWIPYNKENELLIKSQNPMYLEWGIDANEWIKYWNKILKWKLRAVDDQWNSLKNVDKDISITVK